MMVNKIWSLLLLVSLMLASCQVVSIGQAGAVDSGSIQQIESRTEEPEHSEEAPQPAVSEEEIKVPTATAEYPPTPEPEVLNPLTGLPVENPENLLLPPALVSVTNFPPTARPQAGLSYSPFVFELYIGDGETRYLALFYGDYPEENAEQNNEDFASGMTEGLPEPGVGPVRSGRLPYEHIRKLYNGFIVMASAYSKVSAQLKNYVNEFGDDRMDPNSAIMPVAKLKEIAEANQGDLSMVDDSSMKFDAAPPEGGKDAKSLWIFYAYLNQVFWRYVPEDGAYHRWQDKADGSTFVEQTDRLNGEPLTYENVIVLFADHEVEDTYLIDVNLLFVNRGKALLFRDGKVQEIYWTTWSEEYEQTTGKLRPIRFIDAEGNPVSLKPGQTWVEIMPQGLAFWETVDSEAYHQLASGRKPGSGHWGLYFKLAD